MVISMHEAWRISEAEIKNSADMLLMGYVSLKQRRVASANMMIAWLYAYCPYEWAADHDRALTALRPQAPFLPPRTVY